MPERERLWLVPITTFILLAIFFSRGAAEKRHSVEEKEVKKISEVPAPAGGLERATFAGGCFWCMETPFEGLHGVTDVISGYTGGTKENPTYEEVSSGSTGHMEAVQVIYDPTKVTYSELLDVFWRQIDPTDPGGQFVDRGEQYRTAVFYHSDEQKILAEQSKKVLDESGRYDKPIVTLIEKASTFYRAEEYHQDYYMKAPLRYKYYRYNSGRDRYLKRIWGDSAPRLTPKEKDASGDRGDVKDATHSKIGEEEVS